MPRNTGLYGGRYWCVLLADEDASEVYAHADRITMEGGVLALWRVFHTDELEHPEDDLQECTLTFAPGQWRAAYAASLIDGSAVSVDSASGPISAKFL